MTAAKEKKAEKSRLSLGLSKLFDTIGGIFKPILIVIIGAGVLQALRDILLMSGAISRVSSSYILLDALGQAVFYFLPIFLAISSAQVFGATPFLAAAVAAFLLYPNIVDLFEWANSVGWNLTLFGAIPVTYAKYPSSVLPIILIIWFQSKLEPLLKKIIPNLLKAILIPVLTLFITCIIGLVIIGPIGTWVGDGLALGIGWLNSIAAWLVPTIVGALSPFLVMTGSHYSLFPVATQNLAQLGYDTVLLPGMLFSNLALAGASFAIALRAKQAKYKSYSASAGLTSLFGISQSSLYGQAIPLKTPLIASIIGGGAAGFYAGITGVQCTGFMPPGLLSLVAYLNPTANLINTLIAIVIAFAGTLVLTFVMGFKEPDAAAVEELTGESTAEAEDAAEALEQAENIQAVARTAATAAGEASFEQIRVEVEAGVPGNTRTFTTTAKSAQELEAIAERVEAKAAEAVKEAKVARAAAEAAKKAEDQAPDNQADQ